MSLPDTRAVPTNEQEGERMTQSENEVQAFTAQSKPEPRNLDEALRRINTTFDDAWNLAVKAKRGFCAEHSESPCQYDQGDTLVVCYDDLYDLACIALVAMTQAKRAEIERIVAEREDGWAQVRAVVDEQADDPALWALNLDGTQSISEAYLQQELRRLHAVIESRYRTH